MIELQLAEKQNFENLKYKKKLCGLCEIYRKNLQNQHNLREHILIFELPSSDFYPISIPFSTVSSGVTKINFPSGLVVKSNIP